MEGKIDSNVPLDYIEFQISPDQNRYEVSICIDKFIESVSSGPLEPLLLHSQKIRELHAKGCNATYHLVAPDDLNAAFKWFTKSTIVRFLDIIGSSEALNATVGMRNEISQLEEARRFHLSLYTKGPQNHLDNEDEGSSTVDTASLNAGTNSASSDDSKNELLRAMDLRLTALKGELAEAFGQAAINRCSTEEVDDLEKFASHFGATDLRSSLSKIIESSLEKCIVHPHDKKASSRNALGTERISNKEETVNSSIQSQSEVPVKYGVSPAKVAEIERQSSSDNGESSYSSEEEQPSMERSRSLIRSASPRRSASPMRRIQIGRSGSRRLTPLTIKSLNYFPRERLASHRDAAEHSSDEEASEQPSKRSEMNVRRMSVQDAINLFESKQRNQNVDIQKTKSLFNATMGANKSVLRRWSAGTVESSNGCHQETVPDNSTAIDPDNVEDETANSSSESKPEYDYPANAAEVDSKPDSCEQSTDNLVSAQETVASAELVGTSENLNASAEWSRQKEAELNQLLMKMMETKPVKYQKGTPENNKSQNLSAEQRGGSYDNYKEKRNEKLRRETPGKRSEKEKKFQAMQQILDERKAQMVSSNTSDGGKRRTVKTEKSQKTLSQPNNTKKDVVKPAVLKKPSPKASSLPATRQSWPSAPSTRTTGLSPAKTSPGATSARVTPTRRKSQPPPVAPKSNLKLDRTEPQPKSLKATQKDTNNKTVRNVNEKKQKPLRTTTNPSNTKAQTNSTEPKPGKPSLYNKVTKKGSVVPLESKTFLRKGSGIGSGVTPASRTKVSSQPEESGDLTQAQENERTQTSSDPVIQLPEAVLEPCEAHVDEGLENQEKRQEDCADIEIPNQGALEEVSFQDTPDSKLDTESMEEVTIPPTAWVEIEEHEDDETVPSTNGVSQIESSSSNVAPMGMPSPRVHHSLSQMLLEESSEPDVIEWGNAENPRSMVYQRDAPKGLKRLLKFARKSKTDANSTGWSSPSVFSEGEDDTEESKSITKRSTENLLRKATLHGKNHAHQRTSLQEKDLSANGFFAQANTSKSTAQNLSEKLHNGQIAASVTTTKATRSFFSLSAFKGGKQNEIKFR